VGLTWDLSEVGINVDICARFWTYLHVTFCDIKRCDTGMGDTAGEDTTEHTLGIIRCVVGHRPKIPVAKVKIKDVSSVVALTWRPT
jgi:hypothetical protein